MADAIGTWLATYSSESGRRSMESSLRSVMRAYLEVGVDENVQIAMFPWDALADWNYFKSVAIKIEKRYGKKRGAKHIIALRSLVRSLAQCGLADFSHVSETLARNKVKVSLDTAPSIEFSTSDLWRILLRCRQDPSPAKGARDLALISLGLSTGARRAELVHARLGDLNLKRRTIEFEVKGGGQRIAAIHGATIEHLEHWLTIRGDAPGPLFPALRKGGRIGETHLSDHQFWKILTQRSGEGDVTPAIRPHDLRRWYVSSLLENGIDIFQVMRAVGHRRVQTTFRYDRRPQDQLLAAIDSLELPGLRDIDELEK